MCARARGTETYWFDELSMKEAEQAAKDGKVIIIPVGSVEEHGDHLPLNTDSLQAEYVALEVAKKANCLVSSPLRYGICNSTRHFPGTLSISFDSLRMIIIDILEEFIRNGFRRILILSGHAGRTHMAVLKLAARSVIMQHKDEKASERPRIMVCSDYDFAYELKGKHFGEEDAHGGTIETSRVMAIRSDLIKGKGRASFPEMPRFEIVPDPERYFPSGIMGDPTIASVEKGQMINEYVVKEVRKLVEELKNAKKLL
ncbi:MAG: creatininase family protein [Candidatus Bathyarchaeota archaeon]|nr:MAG: creatininase family protein [Candidatus Bathyarchaeota archaeon]